MLLNKKNPFVLATLERIAGVKCARNSGKELLLVDSLPKNWKKIRSAAAAEELGCGWISGR